jgi:uncharacterized membrane protein
MGNVVLNPVLVIREREVDVNETISGLPNNDVEALPLNRTFLVTSATSFSGYEYATLERAAVSYIVTDIDDGLPMEYQATVTYRGVETYSAIGYYTADASFTSTVALDDVNQYIIIATYEPVNPPVSPNEPLLPLTPTNPNTGPGANTGPNTPEFTEEEQGQIDNQTGNVITDIVNGNVPLGNISVRGAWSFASLLLSIAALVISLLLVIGFAFRRKSTKRDDDDDYYDKFEDERKQKLQNLLVLKIATIVVGVGTFLVWFVHDQLSLPMVWINSWTLIVTSIFIVQLVLLIIYVVLRKKDKQDDDDTEYYDGAEII